jgi:20S proteasome alpha/beta subunit
VTLILTVYVPEGIVMAADSRQTLSFPHPHDTKKVLSLPSSDSTHKLFMSRGRVGISMCGSIGVDGKPLASIVERIAGGGDPQDGPEDVANRLLQELHDLTGPPVMWLQVAGYDKSGEQRVFAVDVAGNKVTPAAALTAGAVWYGETDVLSRMLNRASSLDASGNVVGEFPNFGVAWNFFTLQDAVDFAVYAIRSTADTMRFQVREQTVGGPIDILVIRPAGARWLNHKALRVNDKGDRTRPEDVLGFLRT